MRPHKLTLTAFGAFPKEVVVDFDALSPFGLFHIHGPTGAGKSTLLDALCFALYGKVPGLRSRARQGKTNSTDSTNDAQPDAILQCHHGDITDKTRVCLEFSAQGSTYVVEREPPQYGKRGGFNAFNKAFLFRLNNGEREPLLNGIKEVDAFIQQLVGLDAAQFMQVVVLPQGLFAEALRADSRDRGKLFQSLFDTVRFGSYTERLKALADTARAEYNAAAQHLGGRIDRVVDLAERLGISADLALDHVSGFPTPESLAPLNAAASECASARKKELEAARSARMQAVNQSADLNERTALWERHRIASAQMVDCDEQSESIEALRQSVADAQSVAPLVGFIDTAKAATSQLDLANARVTEIQTQLASLANSAPHPTIIDETLLESFKASSVAGAANNDVESALKQTREGLGKVQTAVAVANELKNNHETLNCLAGKSTKATDKAEAAHNALAYATNLLAELKSETESLQPEASQRQALQDQLSRSQDKHQAARDHANHSARHSSIVDAAQSATDALQSAEKQRLELLTKRIESMSGELAAELQDGQPCTVCGSCNHPQPAVLQFSVTEQMLEDAERKVTDARTAADRTTAARQESEQTLALLKDKAGDYLDSEDLGAAALAAVSTSFDQAAQASTRLEDLKKRIGDGEAKTEQLRKDLAEAQSLSVAAKANFHNQQTRVSELQAQLGEADADSLDSAASWLETSIGHLEALQSAIGERAFAVKQDQTAQLRLKEALEGAQVDSVQSALAMAKPLDEISRLRTAISDWTEKRNMAAATIKEIETANKPRPEPDELEQAKQREAQANQQHDEALARATSVNNNAEELATVIDRVERDMVRIAPQRIEAERLSELYELCSGGGANAKRFSLEHWVMAGYLEEVIEAANVRLDTMTQSRYELRHTANLAANRRASGLDIEVFDSYTGRARGVTTLSGGETFLASLALALGTADIVQRHAGGIHIEALFIDEGFGTLDPETLELAIDELDKLREGGRLVGIISHVDSLKSRIPVGIEVKREMSGSRIVVSTG